MSKQLKITFLLLFLFMLVTVGLIFAYSGDIAVLSPKGMIAEKQKQLLLIAVSLMLIVVIPVFALTFGIAWKYRANNQKAKYHPKWGDSLLAEAIWWGIPFIIIIILGVFTYKSCHELDPFKPLVSDKKPVRIQVVALQWKWLFIYPDYDIATVNYIQFPEQVPINFEITADAPMNSFWIPDLGGQVYAMAGMRSKLHLIADKEGQFRGASSNISGKGFAGMFFYADATSQEGFQSWVDSVKRSSPSLDLEEYDSLVLPSEYVPPSYYRLEDDGLFDQIMNKYMAPMSKG